MSSSLILAVLETAVQSVTVPLPGEEDEDKQKIESYFISLCWTADSIHTESVWFEALRFVSASVTFTEKVVWFFFWNCQNNQEREDCTSEHLQKPFVCH